MDREKVIKAVQDGLDFFEDRAHGSRFEAWIQAQKNAIALLKAQEPRVMTLEEVEHFTYGSPYIIETNLIGSEPHLMYGLYSHQGIGGNFDFAIADGRKHLFDTDYGKTWRCWTSSPTDEQREAEPWRS